MKGPISSRWQSSIRAVNFTVSWCGIFVFFPFSGISVNNKNRRGTFTLSDGKLNNSVGTIIRGQSEISGEKWWGAAGFSLIPSANTSHMDGGTCSDSLSRVSSSFTHPLSCFILFFFFSFALFPSGALCLARVWLYAQHCSGSAVWIRCACACGCGEGSGFSFKAPLCCPPVSGDYKRIREPRPWLHPQNQWPNGNYAPGRPTFDFRVEISCWWLKLGCWVVLD